MPPESDSVIYVNSFGYASFKRPSFIDPVKYAWNHMHPDIVMPKHLGGIEAGMPGMPRPNKKVADYQRYSTL